MTRSPTAGPALTVASPLPGTAADLGPRLLARVVDGLVLALAALALVALTGVTAAPERATLLVGLGGYVYAAALDATGGTPGKRLLRLAIVGPGGRRPGLGAGATRNLWLLTSLLPGLVGTVAGLAAAVAVATSIARDPSERGWHDRVAGTAVRRPG